METIPMTTSDLVTLLESLAAHTDETEWVEFKVNYAKHELIGEYISALSNSAALNHQPRGYIVWGVDNGAHTLVGTKFKPKREKVGNENLENWLTCLLEPRIIFRMHEFEREGANFVIFEVPAANGSPLRFKTEAYFRLGSYKKKLREHPEREQALWRILIGTPAFERSVAQANVSQTDVLDLLDVESYWRLTHGKDEPLPQYAELLHCLEGEKFVVSRHSKRFDITSLGAALLARDLENFGSLARKAPRVITYVGSHKVFTKGEVVARPGYAAGFESLMNYIYGQLPENELVGRAFRRKVKMYPDEAIRELVANAIIHQDLDVVGTGPRIEIFSNRIEITNPGVPLIDTNRFLDAQPQSRNDAIAAFMHRAHICEERGSGIDKVFFHVEVFQLPPPDFYVDGAFTVSVLFAHRTLSQMGRNERIRACYQHAGLQYLQYSPMTNITFRKRLGISDKNYAVASRIIKETLKADWIKPFDPQNRSRRHAKYVPFWAPM